MSADKTGELVPTNVGTNSPGQANRTKPPD